MSHIRAVSGIAASRVTTDANAQAYMDLWSPAADATHITAIDDFYVGLKADGIYTKLDEFWILGNQHEQCGLLGGKLLKNCTNVNAAAFVADRGFTGAATKYLNTNFVPSVDGVNFTQNDASFGIYCRTEGAEARGSGINAGANINRTYVYPRYTGDIAYFSINQPAAGEFSYATTTSLGLWVVRRTASNAVQAYRNGSQVATSTGASDGRAAYAIRILTIPTDDTPGLIDTRQHSFAFIGASLSATEQANLFTRIETLGDALGWGVI